MRILGKVLLGVVLALTLWLYFALSPAALAINSTGDAHASSITSFSIEATTPTPTGNASSSSFSSKNAEDVPLSTIIALVSGIVVLAGVFATIGIAVYNNRKQAKLESEKHEA